MGILSVYFDKLKNLVSGQYPNYLILRLFLSLGAIGSSIGFFYILGYLFLYGYFFGSADKDTIPSFIEILLNNVPFSHSSVTFVGFIYFLTISIISIWLLTLAKKLDQKKDFWSYLVAGLFLIIAISAALSLLFLGKFSLEILIIWILPSVLILWFSGFLKTIDKPLVLVSAFINSLYFIVSYALFLVETNTPQTPQFDIFIGSLILFIFIPTFSLIFTSRKFAISNKALFIIPILLIITTILTSEWIISAGILIYIY